MLEKHQTLDQVDYSDHIDKTETAEIYIGGYRLSHELASSPSCRTFLGETASLSHSEAVVIKWFHSIHLTTQQAKQGFLREAGKLKRLQHPAILPILSAGIYTDTPYLVMPYMDHGSLYDRLQSPDDNSWAHQQAITIVTQLGQALTYAHELQVYHGNLKIQNILFNADDEVRLTDFAFPSLHPSPEIIYTYALSPTSSNTQALSLNDPAQQDQLALGRIAYELLTGQTPDAAPIETSPNMKDAMPVTPRHFNASIAPQTEEAVLKALAPTPSQRHEDITAFLRALKAPTRLLPLESTDVSSALEVSDKPTEPTPTAAEFDKLPTAPNPAAPPQPLVLAQSPIAIQAANDLTTCNIPTAVIAVPHPQTGALKRQERSHMLRQNWSLFLLTGILCLVIFSLIGTQLLLRQPAHTPEDIPSLVLATSNPQPQSTAYATVQIPQLTPIQQTPSPVPTVTRSKWTLTPHPSSPQPTVTPWATSTPSPAAVSTSLLVSPPQISPATCSLRKHIFTCKVTLALHSSSSAEQAWWAEVADTLDASLSPNGGTLAPGEDAHITIQLEDTCPASGAIVFYGTDVSARTFWSCQ